MNELFMFWNTSHVIPYVNSTRVEDFHIYNINPASVGKRRNLLDASELSMPPENVNLKQLESPARIKQHEMKVFKLAVMIYLTVIQRNENKEKCIPNYLDLLKAHMNQNIEAAQWFLQQFSSFDIIKEMLFECPLTEMR